MWVPAKGWVTNLHRQPVHVDFNFGLAAVDSDGGVDFSCGAFSDFQ
jgi:hypothetical protein